MAGWLGAGRHCLRIAAWVPLLGLFARERVAAIALGEWLSLPLFAVLITVVRPASLQTTAVLYVVAYLLYFLFNRAANRRRLGIILISSC